MNDYKLTRYEQETHVWGNADSNEWEIYTCDPKDLRLFEKRGYPLVRDDGYGKRYKVPRRVIRFGRLEKRKPSAGAFGRGRQEGTLEHQDSRLEQEKTD